MYIDLETNHIPERWRGVLKNTESLVVYVWLRCRMIRLVNDGVEIVFQKTLFLSFL